MYLYFNNQGVLKEIVNDDAIRQGNHNINKIRFFIEGAEPEIVNNVYKAITFITGVRTFIDVEGNQLTTESFSLTTEELEIPYNKKRELKFFKYFTKYEMFSITVPDDILNESGTVGCRVQMVSAEGIITLGLIVFNVEITTGGQAIIEPDTAINIAQWNYLISNMLTPEKYVIKYNADANEWDVVPTEGSTKPVTSGGVATAIANALSAVYKIQGSQTISGLNGLTKSEDMNGYVYNVTNGGTLTNEDATTITINAGDNVVFVWNEGDWYWDKLSGIIDTSNLVTTNTEQTITGAKSLISNENNPTIYIYGKENDTVKPFTIYRREGYANFHIAWDGVPVLSLFNNTIVETPNLQPAGNNNKDLGTSARRWKDLYLSGKIYVASHTSIYESADTTYIYNDAGNPILVNSAIRPLVTNSKDLGSSSLRWKDLYLSGKITNGANEISFSSDNDIILGKSGMSYASIFRGTARPFYDNLYDLGSSIRRWKDLYLTNSLQVINTNSLGIKLEPSLDGIIYLKTTQNAGTNWYNACVFDNYRIKTYTIQPLVNNSYTVGTSTLIYATVYTADISDGTNTIAVADIGKKLYKHTIETDGGGGPDLFILSNRASAYELPIDWLSLNTNAVKVLYNGCLVLRIYESGGVYYAQYINDSNTITNSSLNASTIEDTVTEF